MQPVSAVDRGILAFGCIQLETVRLWKGRIVCLLLYVPRKLYALYVYIRDWVAHFFTKTFYPQPLPPHLRAFRVGPQMLAGQAPPTFDPTMTRLQTFVTNLTVFMGNSLYSHFVQPLVQAASAPNFPSEVLAKWQPLIDAVSTAIANAIGSAFDDALSTADSQAKNLLYWLIHGKQAGPDVQNRLFTALKGPSVSDDFLHRFIAAICDKNWLTGKCALGIESSVSGLMLSLLTKAIQALITNAITALAQEVSSLAQSANLLECIQTNCQIIGQTLGSRFATLIQTTSPVNQVANPPTIYQQGYDSIVDIFYKHVAAVIASDVDLQKFCSQDACDPIIRQILTPPAGQDPATYQSDVEQALSLQFAQSFVQLLLPDQRQVINGFTQTTPGIVILLRSLQIPQSLITLFKEFLSFPNDLFPDGPPVAVQTLFNSVVFFVEKGMAAIVNDQIDTGLGKGLNLGMNMVVPPIYLTMWMVKGAFPALFPALEKALLAIALASAGDSLADHFKPLADPNCNRPAIYATLLPYLQGIVQDMCKRVQFADVGVTSSVWATQVTPMLDEIADYFVSNANGKPASKSDIKSWLEACTKPVDVGSNSTYGKLLTDLMCSVGNIKALGNEKFSEVICKNFLSGIMSKMLTSAMDPLRCNEQLIVGGILNGLSNIMSTQQQVDDLLFKPPTPPVDMSAQLDVQLDQMSWLVYTIIHSLIDQVPDHSNWFTRPFKKDEARALKEMVPSQKDIKTGFTRVYSAVFGNRYLNENLYIQVVRVILKGLQDGNSLLSA